MITFKSIFLSIVLLVFQASQVTAQSTSNSQDKKYSLTIGTGYFGASVRTTSIAYENADYNQNISPGFTYFASLDYKLSEQFAIGLGYNGNYASAKFIENAVINGQQVNGFLKAGAVANSHVLVNLSYASVREGIQPFVKLGLGYFKNQVELGDVPLSLTDNVEVEMFPDFKYASIGIIPELGVKHGKLLFSAAYTLPFGALTGETVPGGFESQGSISSSGIQINLGYQIPVF